MLTSLHIQNVAVIEKTDVDFNRGLNVLTGETGAGKSILIDAINAVLGERTSRGIVRTGSDKAIISAVFEDVSNDTFELLNEMGFDIEKGEEIIVNRIISADGKGSCRINGLPITVSMLRDVGRRLINIHGQHENQALLSVDRHLDYLEIVKKLKPLRSEYEEIYNTYANLKKKLRDFTSDESDKAGRIDLLKYQINEIEEADLKIGELDDLVSKQEIFRNSEKIAKALTSANELLSGGEEFMGAYPLFSKAVSELNSASEFIPEISELFKRAEAVSYELEDIAGELRRQSFDIDFSAEELEFTEERIDQIRRIVRKYVGISASSDVNDGGEEAVLLFLEKAKMELDEIEMSDDYLEKLNEQALTAREAALEKALELSNARKKAALEFSAEVKRELEFLDMPNVQLVVDISQGKLGKAGFDVVEFLISVNAGENPQSIAKIASGGELSRIMLAIKSVLAEVDEIDSLIFDEIDAGISGRAAQKVGIKLREISKNRQVLCVTHLAQIAAQAHHHYLINKMVKDGRTYTSVDELDMKGRERELGRIISGDVTEKAIEAGREMLNRVEK